MIWTVLGQKKTKLDDERHGCAKCGPNCGSPRSVQKLRDGLLEADAGSETWN